jgi:hypothetical protein
MANRFDQVCKMLSSIGTYPAWDTSMGSFYYPIKLKYKRSSCGVSVISPDGRIIFDWWYGRKSKEVSYEEFRIGIALVHFFKHMARLNQEAGWLYTFAPMKT